MCVGIGGTVGSDVFATTGEVISGTASPVAVINWTIGDLVCCINGVAYMELSTRVPSSGSAYANLSVALITALCVAVLLCGVRCEKLFVNIVMTIKVGIVLFIIVAGFVVLEPSNLSPFVPSRHEIDGSMAFGYQGILTGASQVFFGCIGFEEVCCLAAEAKNPKKIMPVAAMGTVIGLMILSGLASLVLAGMIPYYDATSFATAFEYQNLGWVAKIVRAGEALTMPVVVLIAILAQPRLNYALACCHQSSPRSTQTAICLPTHCSPASHARVALRAVLDAVGHRESRSTARV